MSTKQDNENELNHKKVDDVKLSLGDLFQIRDNIRKAVDVNKPDNELTSKKIIKKKIFEKMGKILETEMGKDLMEKTLDYRNNIEKEIEEKRLEISEVAKTSNQSTGMSKKTKWIIVIALSIIALTLGIWTAVGVFILGTIIISILSN